MLFQYVITTLICPGVFTCNFLSFSTFVLFSFLFPFLSFLSLHSSDTLFKQSMPNVLSKLALSHWSAMAPMLKQWASAYLKHRDTIRRVLLLLFVVRSFLSIRKSIHLFKKETNKPTKPRLDTTTPVTDENKKKRKVEVCKKEW